MSMVVYQNEGSDFRSWVDSKPPVPDVNKAQQIAMISTCALSGIAMMVAGANIMDADQSSVPPLGVVMLGTGLCSLVYPTLWTIWKTLAGFNMPFPRSPGQDLLSAPLIIPSCIIPKRPATEREERERAQALAQHRASQDTYAAYGSIV